MSTPAPHLWLHHLADEADAAFLYRELAKSEPDDRRAELYLKLANVEERHVGLWKKLLEENGHRVPEVGPSRKARATAIEGSAAAAAGTAFHSGHVRRSAIGTEQIAAASISASAWCANLRNIPPPMGVE